MPNVQNLIGPRVRDLRMETGLSQDELAAKLQLEGWDLSRAGVSKIESRLRRVNDAEVLMLSKVLRCPLESLYPRASRQQVLDVLRQGHADDRSPTPPRKPTGARLLTDATPADKNHLVADDE